MLVRDYRDNDELQWVRCRVLSFLDSAYFDNVLREKEHYANPCIELVIELDGKIVGLLDVECETDESRICYRLDELGAVMWHLAVLPEYRKLGIASLLLNEAINRLRDYGIKRLQAWTRDDKWVNEWYKNRGFEGKHSYLHVYAEAKECREVTDSKDSKFMLCNCYAHYTGENKEEIKQLFSRVHECNLYELTV